MAVARPRLQQRIPFVDGQGRLSNEGLRALNDSFQSIYDTIDQIVDLYNITEALNSDLLTLSGSSVVLASPGGFGSGRVLTTTPTITITDGGAGSAITADFSGDTSDVPEGGNLYFTNSRARSALSNGTGMAYDSSTGVIAVGTVPVANGGTGATSAAGALSNLGGVPTTRSLSTGTGLVGGGNLSLDRTLSLATSGVTAGNYGSATKVPTITVDAYGRVTIASENTIPVLSSGKYTPSATAVANIDGVTVYDAIYSRLGDVVTVSGRVDIDATASGSTTQMTLTLPIATSMTVQQDLSGSFKGIANGDGGGIYNNGNKPQFHFTPTSTASQIFFYTYQYRVI